MVLERDQGSDHPQLADALRMRGDVLLAQGSAAAAAEDYGRAIEILERRPGNRIELARARYGLARTRPGSEAARAHELARLARERLASDGRDAEVAEIDAWLATRP